MPEALVCRLEAESSDACPEMLARLRGALQGFHERGKAPSLEAPRALASPSSVSRGFAGICDDLGARALGGLELRTHAFTRVSHPSVLRYHRVIRTSCFVYTTMDRGHRSLGQLLLEHMQADEPVAEGLVLSIMEQLSTGLTYLHDVCWEDASGAPCQGIVH